MLRRATLHLALMALAVISTFVVAVPVAHATSTTTTVSVVGSVYWNDTGIDIPTGATVEITATGIIYIAGSDPGRGPEGIPGCVESFSTSPAPGLTCVALVGRIGDGAPFEIGAGTTFTTVDGGRLDLTINDSVHGDNRGGWTATVTVHPVVGEPMYVAFVAEPINADGSSSFNAKRGTVPVKFALTGDGEPTCDLPPATIVVSRVGGANSGPVTEDIYTTAADSGSTFRITDCHYHYNVATSALGPGSYEVDIFIDGSVVGTAFFTLK